jgi:adenylate cyclase 2
MTEKMSNSSPSSSMSPFQNLFVQRHNNMSILYADIVNFTPLSETLSAYHLVATLNQLFASFDQLAKV